MGGLKAQPAQVIQAPAAPSVSQTAGESLAAQLQYNPQLTAQTVGLQQQYAPQLAQSQYDVASQYTPLYRALLERQFPQISTLSGQVSQELTSPTGLNPQQQAAQDAIRERQRQDLSRTMREQANVGGTLYGGRAQERESRAQTDLANQFAQSDIALQQQQRQQAMQELISMFQLAGLNVQQPTVSQFAQPVAAGGDALYNALVQNQGNFGIIPGMQGTPSPMWDLAGKAIGAGATAAMMACLPFDAPIEVSNGITRLVKDIKIGDSVIGGTVIATIRRARPEGHTFHEVETDTGTVIMSEDHPVIGVVLSSKPIKHDSDATYDILTNSGVYKVNGVWLGSTIPSPVEVA